MKTLNLLYHVSTTTTTTTICFLFPPGLTDNEDMFFWKDSRGVHMLAHSQDNSRHNHDRRGAYAFSPDRNAANWRLSKNNEAWGEDFLVFDDCSATPIAKRQRPSLVFHPARDGVVLYLMTGVATTHHGLQWGDGWTVIQPVNTGLEPDQYTLNCTDTSSVCCWERCPGGQYGNSKACASCQTSSFVTDGKCLLQNVASTEPRDACLCVSCENGRLGSAWCELAQNAPSATCHGEGWKTLPGTSSGFGNGELQSNFSGPWFRCGGFDAGSQSGTGWYGHCIPVEGRCNGVGNCGDNTDEAGCGADFVGACQWPRFRAGVGGVCRECVVGDVDLGSYYPHFSQCLEAQPSVTGDRCICLKGVLKTTTTTTSTTVMTSTATDLAATTTVITPSSSSMTTEPSTTPVPIGVGSGATSSSSSVTTPSASVSTAEPTSTEEQPIQTTTSVPPETTTASVFVLSSRVAIETTGSNPVLDACFNGTGVFRNTDSFSCRSIQKAFHGTVCRVVTSQAPPAVIVLCDNVHVTVLSRTVFHTRATGQQERRRLQEQAAVAGGAAAGHRITFAYEVRLQPDATAAEAERTKQAFAGTTVAANLEHEFKQEFSVSSWGTGISVLGVSVEHGVQLTQKTAGVMLGTAAPVAGFSSAAGTVGPSPAGAEASTTVPPAGRQGRSSPRTRTTVVSENGSTTFPAWGVGILAAVVVVGVAVCCFGASGKRGKSETGFVLDSGHGGREGAQNGVVPGNGSVEKDERFAEVVNPSPRKEESAGEKVCVPDDQLRSGKEPEPSEDHLRESRTVPAAGSSWISRAGSQKLRSSDTTESMGLSAAGTKTPPTRPRNQSIASLKLEMMPTREGLDANSIKVEYGGEEGEEWCA